MGPEGNFYPPIFHYLPDINNKIISNYADLVACGVYGSLSKGKLLNGVMWDYFDIVY